jgi:hypothetical protein
MNGREEAQVRDILEKVKPSAALWQHYRCSGEQLNGPKLLTADSVFDRSSIS